MAPLSASPLPPSPVQLHRWVLDSVTQLHQLRENLHQVLTGHAMTIDAGLDAVPEKMVLVASELATNALRHGLPPTVVTLYRAGDSYVLDVTDHDPALIPENAEARPPGAGGGGLDLRLARDLALDLGWYLDKSALPEPIKHVWAQFPAAV